MAAIPGTLSSIRVTLYGVSRNYFLSYSISENEIPLGEVAFPGMRTIRILAEHRLCLSPPLPAFLGKNGIILVPL